MNRPDCKVQLPNGLAISCLKEDEASWLYDEIFVRGAYTQQGVTLHPNDVVLDVGANIGMFSLYVAQQAPNVTVHAFEPIPLLADILSENWRAHGIKGTIHRFAISDADGPIDIQYYPEISLMSGLHTDPKSDEAIGLAWLENKGMLQYADQMLQGRFRRETFQAERRTLSRVIQEQELERIDLLKVDVERSEHEVLAGLSEVDWPKVKQLVVEVHDIDGRLANMQADLQRRGYKVTVERDPMFVGTEIWNIYATRLAA
jgi:FkbM family methyltransferase